MKKELKKFGITILVLAVLISLGALGLHFLVPNVGYKVLIAMSASLIAMLYILIKVGSVILKIATAAIIVAAIIYIAH